MSGVSTKIKLSCDTLGCPRLATTEVTMEYPRYEPGDIWTEHVCDECLEGYLRRPALKVGPARTPVLCEARCELGTGAGTCPTCGAVYKR